MFSIILLCAFRSIPYLTYLDIKESGAFEINLPTVAAFFVLLLCLGGLVAIVRFTKVIAIDEEKQTVIIIHPLLVDAHVELAERLQALGVKPGVVQ